MKYIKRFNENLESKVMLLFYAFDFDDNILNMPTEIIVKSDTGSEVGMSTSDFAIFRSKLGKEDFLYKGENIVGLDYSTAFRNFRDVNDPEIFKKDVIKAIENRSYGPAWDDFIECLTNGSLFAIITARGHEAEGMRKGVEFIIDNLSDIEKKKMNDSLLIYKHLFNNNSDNKQYNISDFSKSSLVSSYLDICHYVGVSSPSRGGSPDNPEAAKEDALRVFISEVNDYARKSGYDAKVGFSDDDPGNISHMTKVLSSKDINHEELWPYISEFTIKDTNKPDNVISTKISTRINKFDNFKERYNESVVDSADGIYSLESLKKIALDPNKLEDEIKNGLDISYRNYMIFRVCLKYDNVESYKILINMIDSDIKANMLVKYSAEQGKIDILEAFYNKGWFDVYSESDWNDLLTWLRISRQRSEDIKEKTKEYLYKIKDNK